MKKSKSRSGELAKLALSIDDTKKSHSACFVEQRHLANYPDLDFAFFIALVIVSCCFMALLSVFAHCLLCTYCL